MITQCAQFWNSERHICPLLNNIRIGNHFFFGFVSFGFIFFFWTEASVSMLWYHFADLTHQAFTRSETTWSAGSPKMKISWQIFWSLIWWLYLNPPLRMSPIPGRVDLVSTPGHNLCDIFPRFSCASFFWGKYSIFSQVALSGGSLPKLLGAGATTFQLYQLYLKTYWGTTWPFPPFEWPFPL